MALSQCGHLLFSFWPLSLDPDPLEVVQTAIDGGSAARIEAKVDMN